MVGYDIALLTLWGFRNLDPMVRKEPHSFRRDLWFGCCALARKKLPMTWISVLHGFFLFGKFQYSMAISGTGLLEVPTIHKAYIRIIRPKFQGISPEFLAKNMVHLRTSICWILEISH